MTKPGDTLDNDRYKLARRLGGGSMGTVWQARDTYLERTVAVKELVLSPFGDEDAATRRQRVNREAIALAQVEHPVVVPVYDVIHEGEHNVPWIIMRYIPGQPLSALIGGDEDKPPLPEARIAAIALAVLEGLRACHENDPSVCHRDVKPANIIVGTDGSVHLVDFGIARIAGKASMTNVGKIIGTPDYLAPELLDGMPAGPGTDLWALAVTMYQALAGETPFHSETVEAMGWAIKFRTPAEPGDGGQLASLVLQMLRKQPADRPDAADVARRLRDIARAPDRLSETVSWPAADPLSSATWTPRVPAAAAWAQDEPSRHARNVPSWREDALAGGARLAETQSAWTPSAWNEPARNGPTRNEPAWNEPARNEQRGAAQSGSGLSALSGLPVPVQVQRVASMPTDRAAADLLALSREEAARVINKCDDMLAGNLLSAIAVPAEQPEMTPGSSRKAGGEEPVAVARRILRMLPPERQSELPEHMSSVALAAMLDAPPVQEAVRLADRADTVTLVGALSAMSPASAAPLVASMDTTRVIEALRRLASTQAADIIRNIPQAGRRRELLRLLPDRFRAAVSRHLDDW